MAALNFNYFHSRFSLSFAAKKLKRTVKSSNTLRETALGARYGAV